MPPTRTMPPAKAVKTERTHEENQERAYIAASRRSDRSLEARVESARRASEIHKRRTGRSLRVTEEDVRNEEMYGEEDDDLPLQYRHLTAHLRTGNPDFNNRLAAYLTNHVAMRSALEQSISHSYAQQYPNAPQFASQYSSFPSPMFAHQQQQQQQQQLQQQQIMQPSQSPALYRQAPYPAPRPQQQVFQQPLQHNRSASFAAPQEPSGPSQSNPVIPLDNSRRMSIPVVPSIQTEPSVQSKTPQSATSATPPQRPTFPQGSFSQQYQHSFDMNTFNNNIFNAFSTVLPANAQGLLGSTLPLNDPLTSMMMAGSSDLPSNYYNFSDNQPFPQSTGIGKQQTHPNFDGLASTLAPSALDPNQSGQDFLQNTNYFNDAIRAGSSGVTPAGTPGLNGETWSSYIDTDQWDLQGSQSSQ